MDKNTIIEMLSCDNAKEIQEKGIELALLENNLDFVIYHSSNPEYANNCAKVFSSLDYEKSKHYINDFFTWIEDMNNVGAFEIYDYLKMAPVEIILEDFLIALDSAKKRKDKHAMSILLMLLKDNKGLSKKVSNSKTADGGLS